MKSVPTVALSRNVRVWSLGLTIAAVAVRAASRNLFSSPYGSGDWNPRRMYADIRNTTLRVYLFCLSYIYGFNFDNHWGDLTLPVLIVHGKNDSIVPLRNVENLAKEVRQSQLKILDTANHVLILNNTVEVCGIIGDFLMRVTSSPAIPAQR